MTYSLVKKMLASKEFSAGLGAELIGIDSKADYFFENMANPGIAF